MYIHPVGSDCDGDITPKILSKPPAPIEVRDLTNLSEHKERKKEKKMSFRQELKTIPKRLLNKCQIYLYLFSFISVMYNIE